jgi:hypothetical protein
VASPSWLILDDDRPVDRLEKGRYRIADGEDETALFSDDPDAPASKSTNLEGRVSPES